MTKYKETGFARRKEISLDIVRAFVPDCVSLEIEYIEGKISNLVMRKADHTEIALTAAQKTAMETALGKVIDSGV